MTASLHTPERHLVQRPVAAVGRLVRRAPRLVALGAVAITVAMAALTSNAQVATGTDGMAPDNPQVRAATTLTETFGSDADEVVQVLVTHRGGDILGTDGLQAAMAIDAAVRASDADTLLADDPDRPAVLSWLFPAQLTLDGSTASSDDTVRTAYTTGVQTLPDEAAGLAAGLLPDREATGEVDRALALVFLDPSSLPDDPTQRWEAMAAAQRSMADHLATADLPAGMTAEPLSTHLLFAGTDDFDTELSRLFAGAVVLILLILGFVYWVKPRSGLSRSRSGRRSLADVALTLAAIIMAISWMQGTGVLLGPGYLGLIGPMSQFAQVIPVLLVGLGVDYAIHLTCRYREEVGAGDTVADGITGAIGAVGTALLLATLATAVGFLTNLVNPIPDLQDFGVLAAVGIIAAFALMLTFVPAVRLLLDRRAEQAGRLPADALGQTSQRLLPGLMAHAAVLARRAPAATLAVALALGGLGLVGLTQLEVRFSNLEAVPADSPMRATLDTISEDFAGGFAETTDILISGEVAIPAVHNALVAAHDNLAGIDDVVHLAGRPAVDSIITALGQMLASDDPAAAPVRAAAEAAGVRTDLTVPDDGDVAGLYAALQTAMPEGAGALLAGGNDGHEHARISLKTTAGDERGGALAAALDTAFAPVGATGATAVATSQPILVDVIVQAMRDSQVSSLAITLLVVMLLLVAVFTYERRRPMLGVLTVAPVVLVVLWTFGMMAVTDVPFGPITATIAALAIGIGLPYAIHVTHRYVEDRARIPDPAQAITSTVRHTGGAMAGSALTTMAGFGILTTSSLLPFRQLGLVTVYAVGSSLVAATLVQPSLLVLWDRRHNRHDHTADALAAPRGGTPDRSPTPALPTSPTPAIR